MGGFWEILRPVFERTQLGSKVFGRDFPVVYACQNAVASTVEVDFDAFSLF